MRLRLLSSSVLTLFLLLVSCSSPTDPTKSRLLEHILAELPLSLPVQTPANESDPGFQWVTGKCDTLQHNHYVDMYWKIEPFLDEGIHPTKIDSAYQWRRPLRAGSDDEIVLTVIPGDTISFRIEWPGPNTFHEGWVIPAVNEGHLSAFGGVREWYWGPTSYGYHLYMGESVVCGLWTWSWFEMANLTNGSGFFRENCGIELQFRGDWDSLGHGSWWSATLGSGDW